MLTLAAPKAFAQALLRASLYILTDGFPLGMEVEKLHRSRDGQLGTGHVLGRQTPTKRPLKDFPG